MPPRPKYSKEEIISSAFALARERGLSAVVAREVGKRLNTSSSPIFTVFNSMEELQQEVIQMAWSLFDTYLIKADGFTPSFKMRGVQFIHFAQKEPKLFQTLFMQEQKELDFNTLMCQRIHGFEKDLNIVRQSYQLTQEQAQQLFNHVWVYAYGICVLCATGVCTFDDNQLHSMLGGAFAGQMMLMKSGASSFRMAPAPSDSEAGKAMQHPFPEWVQSEREAQNEKH